MEEYINADALKGKTLGIEWCDETKTLSFHEYIDDDAPTVNVAPIADTVKKMQEKLIATFCPDANYCGYGIHGAINAKAKELMEESNE